MRIKKNTMRLVAKILIFVMLLLNFYNAYPIRAFAQNKSNEAIALNLNCISKNLKLGYEDADSYDFNIIESKQLRGASYSWYIKADKGNPDAVSINKRTGLVTAEETGTAYIRCKITLADGTILRPEAKVTVYNNITGVEISNLPEAMIIKTGYPTDFNRAITDTKAGKGMATRGITRWEISDDRAGVGEADDLGIVFPTREGDFKIRAICFQNLSYYRLWKMNKVKYEDYITAASQWYTITVAPSDGNAHVNTNKQLNKALASKSFNSITLSTDKKDAFIIEMGDYSSKSLIVDTPNADVKNFGIFKDITIKDIKDSTWIEYADGNIIYLEDSKLSLVVDSDADIKQIVIDIPGTEINLKINGKVGIIKILQPSKINISGSANDIPLTVEETGGGSIISSSASLNLTLHGNTNITFDEGSEGSVIDKSKPSVEIKVDNKSNSFIPITTNKTGREIIYAMSSGLSNETTIHSQTPYQPSDIQATSIRLIPSNMVLSVSSSALSMFVAVTTPEYTSDTITWRTSDESVATVDEYGVVTPTGLGTALVIASTGYTSTVAPVSVVSGSAIDVTVDNISSGLQSIGATIALELGKGAASYLGGQLMGWGLKEAGIGFEDATQVQLAEMNQKLDQISSQLSNLEAQLGDAVSQISKQILDSEYNTRVGQMGTLIGHITSIREELNQFIKNPIKNNPELLEKSRQEIITNIKNHLISNENLIHNQLIGVGSQESLIKVFSRAVKLDNRFLTNKDSEKVYTMYEYYEAIQVSMLELIVEYYHAIGEGGDNTNNIDRIISTFNSNINKQKKLLQQSIPEDIVIDTKQNIMIYRGNHFTKLEIIALFPQLKYRMQTTKAPLYENMFGVLTALKTMCYNHNYSDWRYITFDELNSWVKDGKNQGTISYLINSGWTNPNMDNNLQIAVVDYNIIPIGFNKHSDAQISGYRISDGEASSIIFRWYGCDWNFDTVDFYSQSKRIRVTDNKYYWIICRTMSNELAKYFY